MLKLTRGQAVKKKDSLVVKYVSAVIEGAVLMNTQYSFVGANYWYTEEAFLQVFDYEEPFEPEENQKVWYFNPMKLTIHEEDYSKEFSFPFGKVFETKEKAEEFVSKIKTIL